MRSDRERLLDIREAIAKIDQHSARDIDAFADDEMQQVWVIYHLQIVGEAAYGLSQQFKAGHPQNPLGTDHRYAPRVGPRLLRD